MKLNSNTSKIRNHLRHILLTPLFLAITLGLSGCMDVPPNYAPEVLRKPQAFQPATGTPLPNFAAANITKIAVVGVDGSGPDTAMLEGIVDEEFAAELIRKGYTTASRKDVQKVQKELDFQTRSGLTDSNAAAMGKMLNAQAIVIISFSGNGKKFIYRHREYARFNIRCSARMLTVQSTEMLWVGSKDIAEDLPVETIGPSYIASIIREVAAQIPSRR